jgi:subtilisin family serine protease
MAPDTKDAMRTLRHRLSTAALTAASLTLAGCGGESVGPGWIPRHGTVTGVITVNAAGPAPPASRAVVLPTGGAPPLALQRPPRLPTLARRPIVRPAPHLRPVPALVTASAHDLIVTFRPAALGAPPVGSAALWGAGAVQANGVAMRARLAALATAGTEVTGVSPAILTAKIRVADTADREAVAVALRRDPAVAAVRRSQLFWLVRPSYRRAGATAPAAAGPTSEATGGRTTPNDPLYAFQSWHYGIIDLPRAWTITMGSSAVLVAVVDDGIRFDHPAITANLTADGYDFVNATDSLPLCGGGSISNADDGSGYDADPTSPGSFSPDTSGTCFLPDTFGNHGLHVAGTIGAVGNDGVGVTGVNWTVHIRPVRALGVGGFGEDYDIAQGILYAAGLPADDGAGHTVAPATAARIINLSLGGPADDTTMHHAITSAANAGVLIVAAAGNDGSPTPQFPAAYPEVLAVAAVGPDGAPASYSSFGPDVALRAPGGNFDLGDATDGVTSTIWNFSTNTPDYLIAEGTSMAAPHVSGVAALLLAHEPGLTAAALRSRLTTYAVGPPTAYGAGLVNAYNSLTQTYGPPTRVYALLYSATTGARMLGTLAQTGGAFTFDQVPDGRYFIYSGTDESGDQEVGAPGRLWGAFGGVAFPTSITVLSAGAYPVSFSIGLPAPVQPNHTLASANDLAIGGYVQATYLDTLELDVYRVTVPGGTFTFETSGWVAACGFALEEATAIGLFSATGTLITSTGYIDGRNFNFCSRLTETLGPGTYYVAVAGLFQNSRYRLQARYGQ